jgi:two-component system, OmpR family, response regulator
VNILLVEDDIETANYIAAGLRQAGFNVQHRSDGRDVIFVTDEFRFDLLIIDRMLPHLDGLSIVQLLRKKGLRIPVLMLSALGTVDDRVDGLKAGGDDYLVKPFAMAELLARVAALLRRSPLESKELTALRVGDLELNLLTHRARRAGRDIELTAKEFQLLEYLMRRSGQVVTRTMLLESVWDLHFDPQTNLIDVHISRLRQALDRDFDRPLLHTVRGAGYTIREPT